MVLFIMCKLFISYKENLANILLFHWPGLAWPGGWAEEETNLWLTQPSCPYADPQKTASVQALLADIFGGNCGHFGWKETFIIMHGFLEVVHWIWQEILTHPNIVPKQSSICLCLHCLTQLPVVRSMTQHWLTGAVVQHQLWT